jgi:CDP-diacylglycerol---glycerol-3-phosphate 3-phosphatidyltransferase
VYFARHLEDILFLKYNCWTNLNSIEAKYKFRIFKILVGSLLLIFSRRRAIASNQSSNPVPKMQVFRKALAAYVTRPLVAVLAKTGITPNMVTWLGFLIVLGAAVLVGIGHPFAAGWVMLFSGCFDFVDGALARGTNKVTLFGGILDSTLDRISEAAMLLGIMGYYLYRPALFQSWIVLLAGLAIVASFMVSYIRSRAEAAKLDCQVGISTRPERVVVLGLGLLLSGITHYTMVGAMALIAFLSTITVSQRLVHVYKQACKK